MVCECGCGVVRVCGPGVAWCVRVWCSCVAWGVCGVECVRACGVLRVWRGVYARAHVYACGVVCVCMRVCVRVCGACLCGVV